MRKFISVFIIVLVGFIDLAIGQEKVTNQYAFNDKNIHQEKIFIHQNTSFLLSGETLYYKVYCLSSKTNYLSEISKIGYIELVGQDKTVIFKHKIKFEKGVGQGDFFIPSNIKSGNYKLIAYTQWMKNGKEFNYCQNDVDIINPFIKNQQDIFSPLNLNNPHRIYDLKKTAYKNNEIITANDVVGLNLKSKVYSPREKVNLSINSLLETALFGDYSISIRKLDAFTNSKDNSSKYFKSNLIKDDTFKDVLSLPELRGELIVGEVLNASNIPVSNIKVAFSIPGLDYIFKIANTNSKGIFYFNIIEEYNNQSGLLQILGSENKDFKISLGESKTFNYNKINFEQFKINSKLKDLIIQKSIYNQIENSYRDLKLNKIEAKNVNNPFYGVNAIEYVLDDYKRFPTLKETILEVIEEVFVKKRKGVNSVHISGSHRTGLSPLILMDGRIVVDHDKLVGIRSKMIKKISIDREKRLYCTQLFDGIIDIETFKKGIKEELLDRNLTNITLLNSKEFKNYFKQIYDNSKKWDRIPDFRSQLLWVPNFKLNKVNEDLVFYTSDNLGDYEISMEGFTKDGQPVSLREIFKVQ